MTAPTLERMKFWIVVPKYAENQIKNPTFAEPDGAKWWTVGGAGVTIEETSDEQRRGAYCMQVNPVAGVGSYVTHRVSVTDGSYYTFSCDLKGTSGVKISISIRDGSLVSKAAKDVTFTGYWQRAEVTWLADVTATDYVVDILQSSASSSNDPFYVDGAQFEQASKASTFFDGYSPGCRWTGTIRNSTSARSANTGLGGELLCINDYAAITKHIGFGMGQWNQILTKMTSGGDMYQTHIRKSRTIALNLAYTGNNHGELQANRKVIIDALRPDLLSNLPVNEQFGVNMPGSYRGHEQRIVRYQGFDAEGNEATQPIDIVCVFEACHSDTPDTETSQQDVLLFTVPSGLFQGAYNEGAELDWIADFPAERIVKRDANGNWVKWTGAAYESLIDGLNGNVLCMAEGPDGKIYVGGNFTNAGGVSAADYLARWNPTTEAWESVIAGINGKVNGLEFDANGNLYIVGAFSAVGAVPGYFVKITGLQPGGTPTAVEIPKGSTMISTGDGIQLLAISTGTKQDPIPYIYIGGNFQNAGDVVAADYIARLNPETGAWSALGTGLNHIVYAMAFAPDGNLYIGGIFTNAAYPYLCKWNGTAFSAVGSSTDINQAVRALAFDKKGDLIVGGAFTDAGGIANADRIAKWNGASWSALGTGTNGTVYGLIVNSGKVYVAGAFTSAGGLTLTDRVAVWSNGAWQPLDIDLPGTAIVYSILPASDGSLYIGGAFSTVGETPDENAECGIVSDRVYEIGVASASANTYPSISVTGPGTLKAITNYSTGKSVMFDGLTLGDGEWMGLNFDPLQLSFRSGWAGRGNLMRYVVPGSDYGDFYLMPGANHLSLFMTDTDSNSGATIVWTPKFWGLDGALL